jgi:hypothetical protein
MKLFIKFKGSKGLDGSYATENLTIDKYYEYVKMSSKDICVFVINDLGELVPYAKELFE